MNATAARLDVGTAAWSDRTRGHLSAADKRSLLLPLAHAHIATTWGRATAPLRRQGRGRRLIEPELLAPPTTLLTRVAHANAIDRLTPALLNHSERTYRFAAALAIVDSIDVDLELLYTAALLHDTGLTTTPGDADFTVTGAHLASTIAEDIGLSDDATETIRSAITLHHSPNVTRRYGPVAFLLSAGAAFDVVGRRSWLLPSQLIDDTVERFPRLGFKREFRAAFRAEARRVPHGRARLLRRGGLDLAVRLAPFSD
jgi:hypothetical protein